jgi:hypothetical protein
MTVMMQPSSLLDRQQSPSIYSKPVLAKPRNVSTAYVQALALLSGLLFASLPRLIDHPCPNWENTASSRQRP